MPNPSNSNHSRFWQRIQGKLILLLLTLLLPILLIQAYAYHERLETRRAEEFQSNLELARAAAQAFETFVNDIIHQELSIGLALTSSQSLTEEDQNRILNGSKRGNSAIWELFWSRPDGVVVAATSPQFIGMNLEDRDYFREVVSGREWTVSDLLLSRTTGRPSFTISRGIRSDTGQLLGIVVAGILPEQLDHILAIKRSKGGGHALVDRKGMLVYRYPALNHPTWEQRNWLRDYPEFGVALNGNETSKTVFAPFEGKNRIVSFAPVSFIGWAASAGRTEEVAMEAITSRLIPEAVLFLLLTLAAFGVALVLSRFISIPVKRLRDHALALGRGETNDPAATTGPAELRELAGSFNEMAERLLARETSLRDQREWLSVTLTSIGDAVMATDTEGRITLLNPSAAALTGWQIEEAVGQPVQTIFRVIDEQTRQPAEDIVRRVLREGGMEALANHTAIITRDEREVAIEESAAPIRDGTGNLIGVVLVFHDVTEKCRMQDNLRESEERFRVMANSIPQLAWIAKADGYIVWYNQRWYDYTGMEPEQMQGWGWQSVHDQEALPSVLERWENSIVTGEPFDMVFPLRGADGSFREFLTRVMPVKDANGDVIRWCGTSTDITERKQIEEELRKSRDELELRVHERTVELKSYTTKLEESNQALQDFAAIASHDLHEPLRKVNTFGNMLKQKCSASLGEQGNGYLERILNANQRMQSLLTALLEYSRLSTKAAPFVEVALTKVIQEVLSDLEVNIVKTGGKVHVGTLPVISADPIQMRQLFQNLIGNALKFHKPDEKPRVQVGSVSNTDSGCQIIVEDNGIGFEEQHLDKIFAPFQRLHGKNSQYEGTGIGLAICKKIVERHGGSITAKSSPGEGSLFIIDLPGRQAG
jgi:PAS domain S-box-containing protein